MGLLGYINLLQFLFSFRPSKGIKALNSIVKIFEQPKDIGIRLFCVKLNLQNRTFHH